MNTILPISVSIILYLINIYFIVSVTRQITNPSIKQVRPIFSKLVLSYTIIQIIFLVCYIYFLKTTFSSIVWSGTVIISFISLLILVPLSILAFYSSPFPKIKYPGSNWRYLDLKNIKLKHILNPNNSGLSILYSFLLLVFIPYLLRALILIIIGHRQSYNYDLQSILNLVSLTVLLAPLFEEFLFRWLPKYFFGTRGLVIGSIIWFFFHPLDRIFTGITYFSLFSTIPVWLPQIIFYIKLWRGRYYWAAFFIHSFTNLALIISHNFLNIP